MVNNDFSFYVKREADRKFSYMDREGGEVSIFFTQ